MLASDTNLNALPLPSSGNITVNLTGTQATFAGAPILPSAVNLSNTREQLRWDCERHHGIAGLHRQRDRYP